MTVAGTPTYMAPEIQDGSCPKEVSEGILQEHGLCGVWLSLRVLAWIWCVLILVVVLSFLTQSYCKSYSLQEGQRRRRQCCLAGSFGCMGSSDIVSSSSFRFMGSFSLFLRFLFAPF